MSANSVRTAIRQALKDGRVYGPEMKKIAREAEKDGRVSKAEERVIREFVNKSFDRFSSKARTESDSFFCRNDLNVAPPRMTTFGPPGEEDGWFCPSPPTATTQAIGEEDGATVTTQALGEES